MARVNIFEMTKAISNESISHPNVDSVTVDAAKEIPSNATNDPKPLVTDDLPNAEASNTKTTEPGPEDGGGDGTAQTVDVKKATTNLDLSDLDPNLTRDQNGGRDIDTLPSQVKAKDGLSSKDLSTSVEAHGEASAELAKTDCRSTAVAKAIKDHPGRADELVGLYAFARSATKGDDAKKAKLEALCDAKYGAGEKDGKKLVDSTIAKLKALIKETGKSLPWEASNESVDEVGTETTELETIDSSGAEAIEKADDLVMDLDGEELQVTGMTDATESKLAELDSVAAKADSLGKATATVERYHGLMQQMHREGRYMSDELRRSISWALEDIDGQMFFHERAALESFDPKSRVSLEASGMAETRGSSSGGSIDDGADPGEVGKGLGSKLKKMFEAGMKIFWRMVNMVSDLITSFSQDVGKIKNHLADLRKRVNVLDGGKEFKMKGASRLVIGDEFVGDSKNAVTKVHKVAQELLMNWPSALIKLVEDWHKTRGPLFGGKATSGQLMDGIDQTIDRAFRSFESLSPQDKNKVPSGFLGSDRIHWSGVLPGNMALYAGLKEPKGEMEIAAVNAAAAMANIDFSLVPGGDSHAGTVDASTPSAGEAVAVIRELEKLCQFIEDARSGAKQLKDYADKMSSQGFADLLTGARGQDGQISGVIVMNLAKSSTESQHRFTGYLINLIKGYVGFLEASLKAEEAGTTIDA